MLLFIPFVSLFCAFFFYVDALKGGLTPRQWALGGLVFGPVLWPLLQLKKQLWMHQVCGYGGVAFRA